MRACREGGAAIESALRTLYREFSGPLYRDAMRTLRDPDTARDVVQDALVKVWQRCALYRGDSELWPWMRAIARHAALDRLRQPDLEVGLGEEGMNPVVDAQVAELSAASVPRPDGALGRLQAAQCFERCWARYEAESPRHAAVLRWIVEDGLSNDDISELLGRSPGATREFISQCRKRARVHFAEWYELAFGGVSR